ncbi:SERTA domain-containing protein 3 [Paramarasmius palmivorus]|uniref:SERTA domain-containing protein 3 n=1 Tax=Paramarasmius palmivorus TaxID=297713 RepID=A0AAW0C9J8_9AGAR
MPNPGSFHGVRRDLLNRFVDGYCQASDEGYGEDFLSEVQRIYFLYFPPTMAEDYEPSAEEMANVNEEDADPIDLERPVQKEGESDDDYAVELVKFELMKKLLAFKIDQLERWFAYQYRKRTNPSEKEPNAYDTLLDQLSGVTAFIGRKRAPFRMFAQVKAAIVEPIVRAELKKLEANSAAPGDVETPDQDGTELVNGEAKAKFIKKGKDATVARRQAIIIKLFNALSEDEKDYWKSEVERYFQQRLQKYEEEKKKEVPTDPVAYQRCIEQISPFITPILQGMSKRTGWCFTLLCGRPEPRDGGRLNIVVVHSGVTRGPAPMNFGAYAREAYKKGIVPLFGRFLTKVYTREEAQARALPDDGPSLKNIINEEEDGVNHDSISFTQNTSNGSSASRHGTATAPRTTVSSTAPVESARSSSSTASASSSSSAPKTVAPAQSKGASSSLLKGGSKPATTSARNTTATSTASTSTISKTSTSTSTAPTKVSGTSSVPASSMTSNTANGGHKSSLVKTTARMHPGGRPKLPAGRNVSASQREVLTGKSHAVSSTVQKARNDGLSSTQPPPPSQKVSSVITLARSRQRVQSSGPSRMAARDSMTSSAPTSPPETRSPLPASPLSINSTPPPPPVKGSGRVTSPIDLMSSPVAARPAKRRHHSARSTPVASSNEVIQRRAISVKEEEESPRKRIKREEAEEDAIDDALKTEEDVIDLGSISDYESRISPSRRKRVRATDDLRTAKRRKSSTTTSGKPQKAITTVPAASSSSSHIASDLTATAWDGGRFPDEAKLIVPDPPNAPHYISSTLSIVRAAGVTDVMFDIAVAYVQVEFEAGYDGSERLGSFSRPTLVADWVNRGRPPRLRHDEIPDLRLYSEEFTEWFIDCSPPWRERIIDGRIRLKKMDTGDWSCLTNKTGPNGISSFVVALAWWKKAVDALPTSTSREQQRKRVHQALFDDAADEVVYTFNALMA